MPRRKKSESKSDFDESSTTSVAPAASPIVFNPKELIDHFTMMIYGARRVGKTHMASYIISQIHERFDTVYLFSGTTEFQPDAWSFIPKEYKFPTLDVNVLHGIISKTQEEIRLARLSIKRSDKKDIKGDALRDAVSEMVPNVLLILDDIINDTTIRSNPFLSKLFVSGRHLRLSLIFLSQTPARGSTIGPIMRSNVDYAMCSEFDTEDDLETIASLFFAKEGKKRGIARINELTKERHLFAVSELHKRGKVSLADHTYSFRAPRDIPEFELKIAEDMRTSLNTTSAGLANGDYRIGFNGGSDGLVRF